MSSARRFLPSISALMCFEAVARLGSATDAANELALTQSAVSRQLKALEDQLSVKLVERAGRSLRLTSAGHSYVREVRAILQRLSRASVAVRTAADGGVLNLSILPAFGMHWLAPRLAGFARAHPEVTINLSTRLAPFDFRLSEFDAAIHFGREDWPGVNYLSLMPETVVPVASPDLVPAPLDDPRALLDFDLLHLETRPRAWARWLAGLGVGETTAPGMTFDQFSTMAQAAVHGLGVALLPTFVAEPYLASKQLAVAADRTSQSIGSYFLVWPKDGPEGSALSSFRAWLCLQSDTKLNS